MKAVTLRPEIAALVMEGICAVATLPRRPKLGAGELVAVHASNIRPEDSWPWPDGRPFTMWCDEFGDRVLQRYGRHQGPDWPDPDSYEFWAMHPGCILGTARVEAVAAVMPNPQATNRVDRVRDHGPDEGELPHQRGGLWVTGPGVGTPRRIEDQGPYADFSPGRWAILLADPIKTTERCPACGGAAVYEVSPQCPTCDGISRGNGHVSACDPIPAKGKPGVWEVTW